MRPMPGLLADMARSSQERLDAARARESDEDIFKRALDIPPAPPLKLNGFDIIAECKLRSPSAGDLSAETTDPIARVRSYARGGACAVSILTEPTRFGGELEHLAEAAAALHAYGVPAMRKDFLIDPYQLCEARVAGAGGALVIIRMLSANDIRRMLENAADLGMFILLEAFDAEDLAVATEVLKTHGGEATLVGLNCRDLASLEIDFARLAALKVSMPRGYPLVAESGINDTNDVEAVAKAGYGIALIGSALMRSPTPETVLADMLRAGRRA